MKKILNGPTMWRAKCPVCDCEFEYDTSEAFRVYDKSNSDIFKVIQCPNCKSYINHLESVSTATETKMEDTMTT
jgi:hypothetical protein